MTRLQIIEDNRFWEIERRGTVVVTKWGKIGGKVLTSSKTLDSPESAAKFEEDAIRNKRKQGYTESNVDTELVESLQKRLRENPEDDEAALVLADVWQAAGDPRGDVMMIEYSCRRGEDPERVLKLEAQLADVLDQNRSYVYGKPGGFPFREEWLGRGYIAYHSDGEQRLRGKDWASALDRVHTFLSELTDAKTHSRIVADKKLGNLPETAAGLNHTDLKKLLQKYEDDRNRYYLTVYWDNFRFTYPNSDTLLPFQTGAFYPSGDPLSNSMYLQIFMRDFKINLSMPFESVNDDFTAYYKEITKRLGNPFKPRKWFPYVLNKRGDGLKRGSSLHLKI